MLVEIDWKFLVYSQVSLDSWLHIIEWSSRLKLLSFWVERLLVFSDYSKEGKMGSDSNPCCVLKHCVVLTWRSPVSHLEVFMNNVFLFADVISILVVYEVNLMFKTSARLATLKSQPPPLSTENTLQQWQQCPQSVWKSDGRQKEKKTCCLSSRALLFLCQSSNYWDCCTNLFLALNWVARCW